MTVKLELVKVNKPDELNIIIGQSHFIKTVEDIYEVIVGTAPQAKFGLAFCESSGKCLVRAEGNDGALKKIAIDNALHVGCGHSFFIILKDAYPVNILNQVKNVPEVCRIFCATANAVEIIVAETQQGRGILGVIDGFAPKGVEKEEDVKWRKDLLRKIGYKL
ncbi:MAG: adenosine-specific kinase [Candidatus Omnitrophota bacterium]|nr:adenosine-specific kinase [Candidatus Omnitrophota bacterium]